MTLRLVLPVLGLLSLGGCIVRSPVVVVPVKTKKSKLSANCDNNQYWDGEKCRHKGKGKGARKHDD